VHAAQLPTRCLYLYETGKRPEDLRLRSEARENIMCRPTEVARSFVGAFGDRLCITTSNSEARKHERETALRIRKSQTHVQYRESTLVVQQEQKTQSTQSEQGSLTTVVLQHRGPENTPLAEVRQCQVTRANLRLALAEEELPARPDELGVRDELELNCRAVPRAEDALVVVDPNDTDSLSNGTAVQHGLIALL
jgi:hypothetical protein